MPRREVLFKYLLLQNSGGKVPVVIKSDPSVQYVREMVKSLKCPICGKDFRNYGALVTHLHKGGCYKKIMDFVDMTIARYRILNIK